MTAAIITGYLNDAVAALTPVQRWSAMRTLNSNPVAEHWFVVVGIVSIVTLAVLFFTVSFNRSRRGRKNSNELFIEYAEKRGLTRRERQILLDIAQKSGIKQKASIFNLDTAFDRGAALISKESPVGQQRTQESKQLESELVFLREKLGFQKQPLSPASRNPDTNRQRPGSRQILVSRKVHLINRENGDLSEFEGTVIGNNNSALFVELATPVETTIGQAWCVRYFFGASVWEFDTSVISYDSEVLVLKHSHNVRFINRRRFLRVSVEKPAFVARFPFTKEPVREICDSHEDAVLNQTEDDNSGPDLSSFVELPKFVPATITELAGPGLRIETSLEVEQGERILIVGMLENKESGPDENFEMYKILEDIGEVRGVKSTKDGVSFGVELTGLSDININELIRATNVASIRKVRLEGLESNDSQSETDVINEAVLV